VSLSNDVLAVQEPLDSFSSYVGMRKYSMSTIAKDSPLRLFLNNQPMFQLGLLDQVPAPK
jgi:hypothetical protein